MLAAFLGSVGVFCVGYVRGYGPTRYMVGVYLGGWAAVLGLLGLAGLLGLRRHDRTERATTDRTVLTDRV